VLVPSLLSAFQDRGLQTVSDGTNLVAEFPAACTEVGKVLIYDDGQEATVLIENITHHHVNTHDETINTEQRCSWISREFVEFLNELFADRVFLWSIDKGAGGGGWKLPFDGAIPEDARSGADRFVWSRRLRPAG
jgi:hypothetical protein